MIEGIIWALFAGLMLGLYALPGKFTKDFKEENTWGLFFMLTMFVVPILATFLIMKGIGNIYSDADVRAILPQMVVTSVLWGIGVMMWGTDNPIMRISSYEEALKLANDSDYGLAAFLFTHDMRLIQRAVLELEFGEIYVNRPMGEQRQGFHNGHKLSGTGGEDGKYGMENYLEKKTMYVNFSQ